MYDVHSYIVDIFSGHRKKQNKDVVHTYYF